MQRIEHFGFTTVEHDAMHQYFSFYGITIDPVVFPISEFRNPLFLRLFCTANRNTHISLGDISLPFVYSQYISVMEQKVAKRCNYNKSYKLISKIIDEMVSKRINEHSGTVSLSLDDTLALIVDICKKWNVNTDVYSALLAEGVLTQGITYNGDEYVYITYERLEDYFLAQKIVSAYAQLSEEQFFEKYSWMLNKPDLLQFFGIVLAEDWEYELSDVFSSENAKNTYRVRNAFLYGLLWRKTTSITEHTIDYINSEILQYEYSFNQFVDVLFALSARPNHPLNAKNAFNFFHGVKMSDRDATFIPIFDELYSNHDSALYRLVEWGLVHASKQAITDDIAESYAIILSWLLISPNNELRDKATTAIIYILNSHMPALLFLMRIFEEIDDPYISERIYAVAFGCVVNEDSPQQVRALAEHVYKNIFDKDVVYPNILLRTYAKNIIDYARHIGCVEDGYFDAEKITPPYNSRFPEIPSDEEIKTYKLDYNSESFRDYHWSQLAILNSMKVEYSRSGQPGGYTADIVIEGFAHHLVAVADRKVIYDFPLVIQRIQFFILISGQPIIEPDFHNRSFPLWCADHARHTIAHNFLNSYQNKSGDFCFYFSNKIGGLICIWMIHRQIVVDHHFQKIIKLIVRTHIGIHDACDIGFLSLSTHSAPFSRNQFRQ